MEKKVKNVNGDGSVSEELEEEDPFAITTQEGATTQESATTQAAVTTQETTTETTATTAATTQTP